MIQDSGAALEEGAFPFLPAQDQEGGGWNRKGPGILSAAAGRDFFPCIHAQVKTEGDPDFGRVEIHSFFQGFQTPNGKIQIRKSRFPFLNVRDVKRLDFSLFLHEFLRCGIFPLPTFISAFRLLFLFQNTLRAPLNTKL